MAEDLQQNMDGIPSPSHRGPREAPQIPEPYAIMAQALRRIASGMVAVFDEDLEEDVEVPLGAEECAGIATEALRQAEKSQFCARFKIELLRIAGPAFADGESVAEYADEAAPSYFDEPWQRDEGPEECARADFAEWEPA